MSHDRGGIKRKDLRGGAGHFFKGPPLAVGRHRNIPE